MTVTIHQLGPANQCTHVFDEDLDGRTPTVTTLLHVPDGHEVRWKSPVSQHMIRVHNIDHTARTLHNLAERKRYADVYTVSIIV